MLKKLQRLSSEVLDKNPWWEYRHDTYQRPDDSTGDFYYVHTPGSVIVIPLHANGRVTLLKQFRYLNQRESWEFVGGGIKSNGNEQPTEQVILRSAKEELLEEAGLEGKLTEIGQFNPMNGASDELCHVFVATELIEREAHPEASEEFERRDVTIEELNGLIESGELWDGMTLAAYAQFLRSRFRKDS